MNECNTNQTQHVTGSASLVAIGVKLNQLKLFDPIQPSGADQAENHQAYAN